MRRTVLALSAVAVLGGLAVPALAAPPQPVGVTVTNDEHQTGVRTTVVDQPAVGVWIDHDRQRVCAGFGFQVPQCVGVPLD